MSTLQPRRGAAARFWWLRAPQALQVSIQVTLTAVMGWFAVALALPGNTLALPPFREFARLGPESDWIVLFAVAFVVGTAGLVSKRRWVQIGSVMGVASAHMSMSYLFLLGALEAPEGFIITTGTGTYAILAMLGYFMVWVRLFEV